MDDLASFAAGYPFALDDYQVAACQHVADGRGVLVAAPTGAGKTVVGEYACTAHCIREPSASTHADQGSEQPEVSRSV